MKWPIDPQPFGDDHPSSFLGALYSSDIPNKETSHDDYRSLDDPTRLHRAGVTWTEPVHLRSVRLRWRAGWASRRFRVVVQTPVGWDPVCDWAAAELVETRTIDRVVTGVAIEQAPGGGPEKAPGTLRLAALSLPGPSPIEVLRDGAWHRPQMPLATDGSPWTVLDISDARALRIEGTHDRLSFDIIDAGDVWNEDGLIAWLERPVVMEAGGETVPCRRTIDTRHGFTRVGLTPVRRVEQPVVYLSDRPHATGLLALGATPPRFGVVDPAPEPAAPVRDWPEQLSIADAEAVTQPLRHAASIGRPGSDARVGLLPDGGIVLRRSAHANVLHLRLYIDGMRLDREHWDWSGPLARTYGPMTVAVDDEGIVLRVELNDERQIGLVALAREGLWPRPLDALPFADDWVLPTHPAEPAWLSRKAQALTFRLVEQPGPEDALARTLSGRLQGRLPGDFQRRLDRLLEEAALFVQAECRVCYGLFPSVYADAIFGLEEDYLFRGLAYWGAGETALAGIRRTYLNAAHLDKRHYLHDLRNGLTPWQLWHLLQLTGRESNWLTNEEVALLRGCARWIINERAKTTDATGVPTEGGWRVFPGLLPPFRYGGDLDFPTQSLYVNAANWCGLKAVADLLGDDHAADLAAYRADIERAFDAVQDGDRQPLHSGGSDPGEYLQLMACGIFDPLGFFPPDHPTARRIDAQVHREGRLFSQLPRFDGWGAAPGIDAVYCHGYLINALRRGDYATFQAGLCGLFAHAFDRELFTAREVGPIQIGRRDDGHWIPGRRLSRSEPCVGSVGVALMLMRHALVTEMPTPGHLRVGSGLLAEWRHELIEVAGLPTLYGPVDVHWAPGEAPQIHAPRATRIEWVDAEGRICS